MYQPRVQPNPTPQNQAPQYRSSNRSAARPIVVPRRNTPDSEKDDIDAKPTLGIVVRNFGSERSGVEVVTIREHSMAAQAGLEIGDFITGVDGKPATNSLALAKTLSDKRIGEKVRLDVIRSGRRGYLDVPLVASVSREKEDADEIAKSQAKEEPILGVEVETPPGGRGAVVAVVEPNSPASRAGLKVGDKIVSVDGKLVTNSSFLADQVASRSPGDAFALQLVRNNQLLASRITLASKVALASAISEEIPDEPEQKEIEASGKSILEQIGDAVLPQPSKSGEKAEDPFQPNTDSFEFGDDEPIDTDVFGPVQTDQIQPRLDAPQNTPAAGESDLSQQVERKNDSIAELEREIRRLKAELAKSE